MFVFGTVREWLRSSEKSISRPPLQNVGQRSISYPSTVFEKCMKPVANTATEAGRFLEHFGSSE